MQFGVKAAIGDHFQHSLSLDDKGQVLVDKQPAVCITGGSPVFGETAMVDLF